MSDYEALADTLLHELNINKMSEHAEMGIGTEEQLAWWDNRIPEIADALRQAASLQAENERLQEIVQDVGGRSTEFAVVRQLDEG